MKKSILAILILTVVTTTYSQVTQYSDRTEWQNAATDICFTEAFNTPGNFSSGPLQLNGFTLEQVTGPPVYNSVTMGFADMYVDKTPSEPQEVDLVFDQPVGGFIADFTGVTTGEVLMLLYDNDMGMVDSYTFIMNNATHGIISSVPIHMIRFRAANDDLNDQTGERFQMDNVEIDCFIRPIPTLSQWGTIGLLMIMLIIGLVVVRQRKVIYG